jgi:two-component system, LuxR family, response regulator FixJ
MMTGHADVPLAVAAMRGGVFDFIEKPFADETILAAVNAALELDRSRRSAGDERTAAGERLGSLSPHERDALTGLMQGQAKQEIARDLGISPRTVEIYRANLRTKMGAHSLSELVRMTILAGD